MGNSSIAEQTEIRKNILPGQKAWKYIRDVRRGYLYLTITSSDVIIAKQLDESFSTLWQKE